MPVKLGELLLKANMVSPQQLQDALNHQKTNGGRLGKAFVSLGFVKDEEITSLLSRQYGVPSVNLQHLGVDPATLKVIPAETARKYQVLPLSRSDKVLKIAMADPTNVFAMDDIKFMTGYRVEPTVASESEIEDAIDRYYGSTRSHELRRDTAPSGASAPPGGPNALKKAMEGPSLSVDDMASIGGLSEIDIDSIGGGEADVETVKSEDEEIDLGNLAKSADAAPVVKLTNVLLVDSLKRGASDIHIEPYEKEFRVRFRIDGILYNVMNLPMKLRDPLISRIKFMGKMKVGEKRLLHQGRIRVRMRVEDRSRDLDFLVSCLPTRWGDKIVMRLLDRSKLILDMSRLGFEEHSLVRFKAGISKPRGVVVMTGPAGSGKTTTLYSAIAHLNKPDVNIVTAEDPVEFNLQGVNQFQVNEGTGASFATVLRAFERLDPDVIATDGIQDFEAAQAALKLALNGRLVLATLNGNDAPSTVSRMVNMGIEPFLVGTAVSLIQAQRLVRRVCSKCKVDVTAEVPSRTLIDIGFLPEQIGSFQVMKGKGCQTCNGTGYKGRVGLYEVMEITEGSATSSWSGLPRSRSRGRPSRRGCSPSA